MSRPLLLAALLLWGPQALAQSTTCRIVTGTSLAFGNYDMVSTRPTDSLATVQVRCDRKGGPQNVSVTMGLGAGANGSSVNNRRMRQAGGSDYLSYGLFRDVGRSGVWGFSPAVDAETKLIAIPNNDIGYADFVIYARIPPQQNVPVGDYSDTVQVTLSP